MKTKSIVIWSITVLVATYIYLSGLACLMDEPMVVENFKKFGYSDSFRYFIGYCEIAGSIGLLIPVLSSLAATGLIIIMAGAVVSHLMIQDGWYFLGGLVFGVILFWIAYERKRPFFNLINSFKFN